MNKRVIIHSAPRSGSTWLGEIINSHPNVKYAFQPLFSYALKGALSPTSRLSDVNRFFGALAEIEDDFIGQIEQRQAGMLPQFDKHRQITHLAYKEVRYHHILTNLMEVDRAVLALFLIRNPIDVMDSWVSSPREFDPNWNVREELLEASKKNRDRAEEFYGLKRWAMVSELFETLALRYPDRVMLVRYDDLKNNPLSVVTRVFEHCGLEIVDETLEFISESQTYDVPGDYSVFRGGKDRLSKALKTLSVEEKEFIVDYVTRKRLGHYL